LKELKSEIDRIEKTLERCREGMQRDFEKWLHVMVKLQQQSSVADPKVSTNLEAFYAARDKIYSDMDNK